MSKAKICFLSLLMLTMQNCVWAAQQSSAYDFAFKSIYDKPMPLNAFKGKVLLVVNTASKCGYTPQYKDLQALYQQYENQGLVVIGVPSGDFGGQEFTKPLEVRNFTTDNYAVTFPLTAINHVKGSSAHPFYRWAQKELGYQAVPKWNFHKLIINKKGQLVAAFSTQQPPLSKPILKVIQDELKKP